MKVVSINKVKVKVFEEEDLVEKLKMKQEDVELVLEYQRKFPELLQDDKSDFSISTKLLHNQLSVGRDYSTWIKNRISKYGFKENIDYIIVDSIKNTKTNGGDRKSKDYFVTSEVAICLCRIERNNPNAIHIIDILHKLFFKNKSIEIKEQKRLEFQFGEMLDKITGIYWEKQFPIDGGKYRLDFYLKNTLIVEYDEEQHNYTKEEDEYRIEFCRKWLNKYEENERDWFCPVIRVKKGQELEGINRIITHLVGFEILDGYNYNFEPCDFSNKL